MTIHDPKTSTSWPIGHTRFSHAILLNREDQPRCSFCDCALTVRLCIGGLSARPVKTLLISRRENAEKFSTFMTLRPYLFSVKWHKYHYIKLINEFLANFLLYLLYRKCCLNADLTDSAAASEATTDHVTLINGPSGRLMSVRSPVHPAIRNPYRAVKYRHFTNDSLSISGANSARYTLAQL